ncbi:MAG: LysR substrate-binding domain-containing protein [Desulfomonilaceae bacterium]
MELRHLRYFVAVAEERHFRRAAERLYISQPPLSQQIQALEQELGVQLFVRDRRSVVLTEAGEVLLRRARAVLESVANAATEAQQVGRGELGRLIVGFMSAAMLARFPLILQAFRATNPGVEVQLRQLPPKEQMEAVAAGHIDVGFLSIAPSSPRLMVHGVEINVESVWEEELVAAVSMDHGLASEPEVPLHALSSYAFITLPRAPETGYYDQIIQLCREAGFQPTIQQEVEQLPAALTLIAAGYGVGLMPVCVCAAWHHLVAFPCLKDSPRIAVAMIWRPDNRSPVLASFLASIGCESRCHFFAAPRSLPRPDCP